MRFSLMNQNEEPLWNAAIKRREHHWKNPIVRHQEKELLQCVCGYTVENQEMDLSSHVCPLADTISFLKANSDSFGGILFEKFATVFRRFKTISTMTLRDDLPIRDSHENMRFNYDLFMEFVVWVTKPPFERRHKTDHRPLRDLFHMFLSAEYVQITQLEPTIFTLSTYYEDNYLLDIWENITSNKGEIYYPPLGIYYDEPPWSSFETGFTPEKRRAFEIVTLRQIARLWKELWDDEWTELVATNQSRMETLDMSNPLLARDLLFDNFLYWIISVPLDEEHPVPFWNMFSNWMIDRGEMPSRKNYFSFLCHTDTLKLRKVKWTEDMVASPEGMVDDPMDRFDYQGPWFDPADDFVLYVAQQGHWYCDDCRNGDWGFINDEVNSLMEEWGHPKSVRPHTDFKKNIHERESKRLDVIIQNYVYDFFDVCQQFIRELKEQLGHQPTVEEARFPFDDIDFKQWLIHGIQTKEDFIRVACETDNSDIK